MDAYRGQARRRGADPALPRLLGERLCLDFANTIEPRLGPSPPQDFLRGYPDLIRWGRHAGLLSAAQARHVGTEGEREADAAAAIFERGIVLREAIYQIFQAIANDDTPAAEDLATVHAEHLAALAQTRIIATGTGFDLAWNDDEPHLDRVLWPVARSAAELLLGEDPARIKQCAVQAGGCGWLFYDESRNASRRWCSMEGCGSQAKMRRYRARRRSSVT